MSRKAGLRASALAAALAMLLGVAGAAIAAGSAAPKLLAPNHQRVAPGRIRLVVEVPLKAAKHGVFVTIATQAKLDKFGHLKECGASRCDFVGPTHWKGDKYSYVAQFNFPGYWSVTPGKYYWQVHYYTLGDTAVYWSGIGSFVVK
ncbi:MAG: hypothetical protein JO286_11670 [Solirubrobacterales bacterium]|nr:hypothetical protein [Solirubrobacterales bacterium]MBV9367905.1 hypothetical protein [Solirubrobacterales bacterium]MBV9681970.1 hypothetical protein [Solirubrobacterales bacterium]MBV9807836.1 hypothetical protein [Solirubrobacterales bacterium]